MLYRVNFVARVGTVDIVNTFHVVTANRFWGPFAPGDPSPTELADEIHTRLTSKWLAIAGTNLTLDRISVMTVTDPNDPAEVPEGGEHTVNLPGTRTVTSPDLPTPICGRVTWTTGFAGRSFRGRSFMPPIEVPGVFVADVIPATSSYRTAIVAFCDEVKNANLSSGGGWTTLWRDTYDGKFVVYSPTRAKLLLDPWASDITGYTVRPDASFLRSRRK